MPDQWREVSGPELRARLKRGQAQWREWLLADALENSPKVRAALERAIASAVDEVASKLPVNEFLTSAAVCRWLKISGRTLRRWVKEKRIPHTRVKGRGSDRALRFQRDKLDAWIRGGMRRPGTPRLHAKRHAPTRKGGSRA
jgi:excisionase family DNA binding protein